LYELWKRTRFVNYLITFNHSLQCRTEEAAIFLGDDDQQKISFITDFTLTI